MDVIQERIEREFKIPLIATAPSVEYHVYLTNGTMIKIDNPNDLPELTQVKRLEEPYVHATLMLPKEYIGSIMEICQNRRGTYISMNYIDDNRVSLLYDLPLSEIVYDFFDKIKSTSRGYASFDYELADYRESNLVKLDILLNGEKVDALSVIVHKDFAYNRGKAVVESLKELIPRQMFEVPIQASIGNHVIARTDIKALRKNVLAKCYGGDITRKRKLLEKQKEGKKRMKQIGRVEVPQEAFLAVLKMEE
jgi:GTP-binding protein LepA